MQLKTLKSIVTSYDMVESHKADFQIAAIAVANSCNTLYTEDGPLHRIVERYLDVKKISDISLPPYQPQLWAK